MTHDEDFDLRLRASAAAYAAATTPPPAHLARVRGERRRRIALAGSVVAALALIAGGVSFALVAGGGPAVKPGPVTPVPATTGPVTPAPTASPAPAPTGTVGQGIAVRRTIRLGHIVLRAPAAWHVTYSDAAGDYTVSTTACAGDALIGGNGGSRCPSFSLITGAGVTHFPNPTTRTYVLSGPYNTSTGVSGCPGKPYHIPGSTDFYARSGGDGPPYSQGLAHVTTAKIAHYTVWRMACSLETSGGMGPPFTYFEQRDWYLPVSKILIVDEYSVPGLGQVLATATWR